MSMAAYYTDRHLRSLGRIIPDLVRHRRVLWGFVSRELRAHYRNAMIGFLWAFLQPLLTTAILTFVFTMVFRIGGSARSSALNILSGLIPWQFLSHSIILGAGSIIASENLVKKVYFPREVVPLATVLNSLTNFAISLAMLFVLMGLFGCRPTGQVLWLPLVFGVELALTTGLVLWVACYNVFYRDIARIAEILLMLGFYGSPVIYTLDYVRDSLAPGHPTILTLYQLNPMAGIITAYRQVLIEGTAPSLGLLAWAAVVSVAVLIGGAVAFRRNAPDLADHL